MVSSFEIFLLKFCMNFLTLPSHFFLDIMSLIKYYKSLYNENVSFLLNPNILFSTLILNSTTTKKHKTHLFSVCHLFMAKYMAQLSK